MNNTLKITSVLSDPTRYHIYQFINDTLEDVTAQDIALKFNIHPNVARLHLTKLEEINLITSETRKTGKGGRPSKVYTLSKEVIQLHFPFRDYQLLAKICLETLLSFGAAGMKAFSEVGIKYGKEAIENILMKKGFRKENMSWKEKISVLEEVCTLLGFYSTFEIDDENTIHFDVKNCPFRELSIQSDVDICGMHSAFVRGIINSLFPDAKTVELGHISDCKRRTCNFKVNL